MCIRDSALPAGWLNSEIAAQFTNPFIASPHFLFYWIIFLVDSENISYYILSLLFKIVHAVSNKDNFLPYFSIF